MICRVGNNAKTYQSCVGDCQRFSQLQCHTDLTQTLSMDEMPYRGVVQPRSLALQETFSLAGIFPFNEAFQSFNNANRLSSDWYHVCSCDEFPFRKRAPIDTFSCWSIRGLLVARTRRVNFVQHMRPDRWHRGRRVWSRQILNAIAENNIECI